MPEAASAEMSDISRGNGSPSGEFKKLIYDLNLLCSRGVPISITAKNIYSLAVGSSLESQDDVEQQKKSGAFHPTSPLYLSSNNILVNRLKTDLITFSQQQNPTTVPSQKQPDSPASSSSSSTSSGSSDGKNYPFCNSSSELSGINPKIEAIDTQDETGDTKTTTTTTKVSRIVLSPVLNQLKQENDIVLHTALLRLPLFELPPSRKKGNRRKKTYTESFNDLDYDNALYNLIQTSIDTKSLIGLLITIKSVLCRLNIDTSVNANAQVNLKLFETFNFFKNQLKESPNFLSIVKNLREHLDNSILEVLGFGSSTNEKLLKYGLTSQQLADSFGTGTIKQNNNKKWINFNGGVSFTVINGNIDICYETKELHFVDKMILLEKFSKTKQAPSAEQCVHKGVQCDGCTDRKDGMRGIRFKCMECFDYDLCLACYENQRHHQTHPFMMRTTPHDHFVPLPPRNLPSIGIVIVNSVNISKKSHQKQYYFETKVLKSKSNILVGCSIVNQVTSNKLDLSSSSSVNFLESSNVLSSMKLPGSDRMSWTIDAQNKYHDGQVEKHTDHKNVKWEENDVIGCLIDMENDKLLFYLNGKFLTAFSSIFTNGEDDSILFPCFGFGYADDDYKTSSDVDTAVDKAENDGDKTVVAYNFGHKAFIYKESILQAYPSVVPVAAQCMPHCLQFNMHSDCDSPKTDPQMWSCSSCTYINMSKETSCALCGTTNQCESIPSDSPGAVVLKYNAQLQMSSEFTCEATLCWRPSKYHQSSPDELEKMYYPVVTKSYGYKHGFTFGITGSGKLCLKFAETSIYKSSHAYITPGEWCTIAIAVNSSRVKFLYNKLQVSQSMFKTKHHDITSSAVSSTSKASLIIGYCSASESTNSINYSFRGEMADVKIWNKLRSLKDYTNSTGRVCQTRLSEETSHTFELIAWYRFDQVGGDLAYCCEGALASQQATILQGDVRFEELQPDMPSIDLSSLEAASSAIDYDADAVIEWVEASLMVDEISKNKSKYSIILLLMLSYLDKLASDYINYQNYEKANDVFHSSKVEAPELAINPNVLTFLLMHSVLRQLHTLHVSEDLVNLKPVLSKSIFCCLSLMANNLIAMKNKSISAESVGLGYSPDSTKMPHVLKLRQLLFSVVEMRNDHTSELDMCIKKAVFKLIADSLSTFYTSVTSQYQLLFCLLSGSVRTDDEQNDDLNRLSSVDKALLLLYVFARYSQDNELLIKFLTTLNNDDSSQNQNQSLKWSSQYVISNLLAKTEINSNLNIITSANSGGDLMLTKREVVRYMKSVATTDWLIENNLDINEITIIKTVTNEAVANYYKELETFMKDKPTVNDEIDSLNEDQDDRCNINTLLDLIFEYIVQHPELEQNVGACIDLIHNIHHAIYCEFELSFQSKKSFPLSIQMLMSRRLAYKDVIQPALAKDEQIQSTTTYPWWYNDINIKSLNQLDQTFNQMSSIYQVKLSRAKCSKYIKLKDDSVTCFQKQSKNWGIILSETGYSKQSGIHRWSVRINKVNPRGHLFLGVASSNISLNTFLGNDELGIGILLSGDLYHRGIQKRSGIFPRNFFVNDTVMEFVFNTDDSTITLIGGENNENNFGVVIDKNILNGDIFDYFKTSKVFPAICLLEPGDSVSFSSTIKTSSSLPVSLTDSYQILNNSKYVLHPTPRIMSYFDHMLVICDKYLKTELSMILKKENYVFSSVLNLIMFLLKPITACELLLSDSTNKLFTTEWIDSTRKVVVDLLFNIEELRVKCLNANSKLHQNCSIQTNCHSLCKECNTMVELEILLGLLSGKLVSSMITFKPSQVSTLSNVVSLENVDVPSDDIENDNLDNEARHELWCNSMLLSEGLRDDSIQTHLERIEQVEPYLSQTVKDPLIENVTLFIQNSGAARYTNRWVLRHLIFHPTSMITYGSEGLTRAIRGVIAIMLYHTGLLQFALSIGKAFEEADQIVKAKQKKSSPFDVQADSNIKCFTSSSMLTKGKESTHVDVIELYSTARPSVQLSEIWKKGMEVKAWVLRYSNVSGATPEFIGASILKSVWFLFDVGCCYKTSDEIISNLLDQLRNTLGLNTGEQVMSTTASKIVRTRSLRSAVSLSSSGRTSSINDENNPFNLTLQQITTFLRDSVGYKIIPAQLRNKMLSRCICAKRRVEGFNIISELIQRIPLSSTNSIVFVSVLLSLPSAFTSIPSSLESVDQIQFWHYLDNLESCGIKYLNLVSKAFHNFGLSLAQSLQKVSLNGHQHIHLRLALLHVWGMKIQAVDHELLLQNNVFDTLHRTMENLRESMNQLVYDDMTLSDEARKYILSETDDAESGCVEWRAVRRKRLELQLVGRATMKVVFSLCSQIADSLNAADVKKIDNTSPMLNTVQPVKLVRMVSGPDTLNGSVFSILYEEIMVAFEDYFELSDGNGNPDAERQLREILSLLLSLSNSDACVKLLCSDRWLVLMFSLSQRASLFIQCRASRLLRKLLKEANPNTIHIENLRNDHQTAPIQYSSVFNHQGHEIVKWFLNNIIEQYHMTGKKEENILPVDDDKMFSLACESISTLRVLLSLPTWSDYANDILMNALNLSIDDDARTDDGNEEDGSIPFVIAVFNVLGGEYPSFRSGGFVRLMRADFSPCVTSEVLSSNVSDEDNKNVQILLQHSCTHTSNTSYQTLTVLPMEITPISSISLKLETVSDELLSACFQTMVKLCYGNTMPEPQDEFISYYKVVYYPPNGSVRVRTQPNLESKELGCKHYGEIIEVCQHSPDRRWVRLFYPGEFDNAQTAWMMARHNDDGDLLAPCDASGILLEKGKDSADFCTSSESKKPAQQKDEVVAKESADDSIEPPCDKSTSKCSSNDLLSFAQSAALMSITTLAQHPNFFKVFLGLLLNTEINEFHSESLLKFMFELSTKSTFSYGIIDSDAFQERAHLVLRQLYSVTHHEQAAAADQEPPNSTAADMVSTLISESNVKTKPSAEVANVQDEQQGSDEEEDELESEYNASISQIVEMGFPRRWAELSLNETGGDMMSAINWIVSNGDQLAIAESQMAMEESAAAVEQEMNEEEDQHQEEEEDDEDEEESDEDEEDEDYEDECDFDIDFGRALGNPMNQMLNMSKSSIDVGGKDSDVYPKPDEDYMEQELSDDSQNLQVREASSSAEIKNRNCNGCDYDSNIKCNLKSEQSFLSNKANSLLAFRSNRLWGPVATSRVGYIKHLKSFSIAELKKEIGMVNSILMIIHARWLMLCFVSQLQSADMNDEFKSLSEKYNLNAPIDDDQMVYAFSSKIIHLIRITCFKYYPFYSICQLKLLCNGCKIKSTSENDPEAAFDVDRSCLSLPSTVCEFVKNLLASEYGNQFALALCNDIKTYLLKMSTRQYAEACINNAVNPSDSSTEHAPSFWYVEWTTSLLLASSDLDSINEDDNILHSLFCSWNVLLHSPSISIKKRTCCILSNILDFCIKQFHQADPSEADIILKRIQSMVLILPFNRLVSLASKRLTKEHEDAPVFSSFLQALVEFISIIQTCKNLLTKHSLGKNENHSSKSVLRFNGGAAMVRLIKHMRSDNNSLTDMSPPWTASFWVKRKKLAKSVMKRRRTGSIDSTRSSKSGKSKSGKTTKKKKLETDIEVQAGRALASNITDRRKSLRLLLETNTGHVGFTQPGNHSSKANSVTQFSFNYAAPFEEWVCLTFVCCEADPEDAGNKEFMLKLFVDSQHKDTLAIDISKARLPLGAIGCSNSAFVGCLYRVCYWNQVLSKEAMQRLRHDNFAYLDDTRNVDYRNMVGCWNFLNETCQSTKYCVDDSLAGTSGGFLHGDAVFWEACDDADLKASNTAQTELESHLIAGLTSNETMEYTYSMFENCSIDVHQRNQLVSCCNGMRSVGMFENSIEYIEPFHISNRVLGNVHKYSNQPITLYFESIAKAKMIEEGIQGTKIAVHGVLEFLHSKSLVMFIGEYDIKTCIIEFSVSKALNDIRPSNQWMTHITFKGENKQGNLSGVWKASIDSHLLPLLPNDCMRFDICAMTSIDEMHHPKRSVFDHVEYSNGAHIVTHTGKASSYVVSIVAVGGRGDELVDRKSLQEQQKKEEEESKTEQELIEEKKPTEWSCVACTFTNDINDSICSMCHTSNPSPPKEKSSKSAKLKYDGQGAFAYNTGVYFWELRVLKLVSYAAGVGICEHGALLNSRLGSDVHSFSFQSNGQTYHNCVTSRLSSTAFKLNDKIGVELDTDRCTLSFYINDVFQGVEFNADNGLFKDKLSRYSPCVCLYKPTESFKVLGLKCGKGEQRVHVTPFKQEEDGMKWIGNFYKGLKHDLNGRLVMSDGSEYVGCWRHDKPVGKIIHKEVKLVETEISVASKLADDDIADKVESAIDDIINELASTDAVATTTGENLFNDAVAGDAEDSKKPKSTSEPEHVKKVIVEKHIEEHVYFFDNGPNDAIESNLPDGQLESKQSEVETQFKQFEDKQFDIYGTKETYEELAVISIGGKLISSCNSLFVLDPATTAGPSLEISDDGLTIECVCNSGSLNTTPRTMVLGSEGFTTGIHYWEVKVLGMEWGSTYIGIAERPTSNVGIGWGNGYGFVNYRATHGPSGEQLYGSYYVVGDIVGVLLDMDRGILSFYKNGKDFHNSNTEIVLDMGIAYSHIKKSGAKKFYPCLGFTKCGDKLSLKDCKYFSFPSISHKRDFNLMINTSCIFYNKSPNNFNAIVDDTYVDDCYQYLRQYKRKVLLRRTLTGGIVSIDGHPDVVQSLCPPDFQLKPGDKINCGRGVANILGACRGCIWYAIDGENKCYYWTPDMFDDLVQSEKVQRVDSTSQDEFDESYGDVLLDQIIDRKNFNKHFTDREWNVNHDVLLADIINKQCDVFGCEPELLNISKVMWNIKQLLCDDNEVLKYTKLHSFDRELIAVKYIFLVVLNLRLKKVLPLINLKCLSKMDIIEIYTSNNNRNDCVYEFSNLLASKCSAYRNLILTRTKLDYWNDTVNSTTTYTSLAPDEYDHPPDIPTVKINRIKAGKHQLIGLSPNERLKRSVFGQLLKTIGNWDSERLKRSYCHLQDAGQKRCFFVNFEGEGVDDHGGPYRAVLQLAAEEEPSDVLGILVPCPNSSDEAMFNRELMVFANKDSTNSPHDSNASNKIENNVTGNLNCIEFFGKLAGVVVRHEMMIALNFPQLYWKSLVSLPVGWKELHDIDSYTAKSLRHIENLTLDQWEENKNEWSDILLDKLNLYTGSVVNGCIPYESRLKCTTSILQQSLASYRKCLKAFRDGISIILPIEIFNIFTPSELETLICGNHEISIDLLKRVTEYEGCEEEDAHIQVFWQALEEMNQEQKSKFINFVCARSRLPESADKFPMNFKIQTENHDDNDDSEQTTIKDDDILPKSQTCFFSLMLPKYSTKDICKSKLIYASYNCNTMEDFDQHNATGFESLN